MPLLTCLLLLALLLLLLFALSDLRPNPLAHLRRSSLPALGTCSCPQSVRVGAIWCVSVIRAILSTSLFLLLLSLPVGVLSSPVLLPLRPDEGATTVLRWCRVG